MSHKEPSQPGAQSQLRIPFRIQHDAPLLHGFSEHSETNKDIKTYYVMSYCNDTYICIS